MRIDHIAYRVSDRDKAVKFFIEAFGYKIEDEFKIEFDDGTIALCYALTPPESFYGNKNFKKAWTMFGEVEFHSPPEIFVSEGMENSIVKNWVDERNGVGGIHHIAYEVNDVAEIMREWKVNGWAEFTTDEPINAKGLSQCFTKPHPITGIIYEFIYRTDKGFNVENVKQLMASTKLIK